MTDITKIWPVLHRWLDQAWTLWELVVMSQEKDTVTLHSRSNASHLQVFKSFKLYFDFFFFFHSVGVSDACNSINALPMCSTARQKSFISLSIEFVRATLCLARIITVLFCVKCVSGRCWGESRGRQRIPWKSSLSKIQRLQLCAIFCRPIHIQCRAPHISINLILSKSN